MNDGRTSFTALALAALALIVDPPACSSGSQGTKIVVAITWEHMTPEACQTVNDQLANNSKCKDFGDITIWADYVSGIPRNNKLDLTYVNHNLPMVGIRLKKPPSA